MFALTWNIHGNRGIADERLSQIVNAIVSVNPDLVMIQEVGNDVVAKLASKLDEHHFSSCSIRGPSDEKAYGNMIAARGPVHPHASGWAKAPWPHLLLRAVVTVGGHEIDVIAAHIPNGSGNGWKKIETLEGLAEALETAPTMPRIVGGDFNEPLTFLADGDLVSFGAKLKKTGEYSLDGVRRCRVAPNSVETEAHPRKRWDDAVKRVLAKDARHGLRHAFGEVHGLGRMAVTHEVPGHSRWFDHLLVSDHFTIEDAGHRDDWRASNLSDHSAVWAELTMKTETTPLPHPAR